METNVAMSCRTFGHCRVITPLNLRWSAAFCPTWAEIRLNTLTNKAHKFVWRPKSFSLNMKREMFACKYSSKFPRSRKLEIQNRLECWSQALGCRAIFKWDKARTILSVTHSGTQTLRVTHVVTHCCPPAPLTQLYTSVMGLGAKTAGRRPSPDQTIGGARCCVWEARVHGWDSVILQTLTFQRTEPAVVCLSARVRHDERRQLSLISLGYLKILILLLGQGLFGDHEDPQAFTCHVSTLEKVLTTFLVGIYYY